MLRRIVGVAAVLPAAFTFAQDHHNRQDSQQRLGVVVPAYDGDLVRAVSSLERWPAKCSPLTLKNADLVLYYAEEESSATASALDSISATAGRCFSRTRIVYANLAEEDDIYPQGPSVMFYNMFLDENVHSSLSEYDALSIVEWDVLVASDNSFEELYHAAFRVNEEFWVKGSNLEGTSFHSSAETSEMWQVLGHINGNAIYNNDDPAFVEYVEYTRARWGYEQPYDVALWMTISDFPYSWPLYQRYSSKFVVTNLISSVGYEHVDHDTVSDAVAGKTLFIHGSSVDEGNVASYKATEDDAVDVAATQRRLTESVPKWKEQEKWKNGNDDSIPKWKRNQKWKTNKDDKVPKWKANEKWKKQYEDSPDEGCLDGCEYTSMDGTRGRVCDTSCSDSDPYRGTLGCGAKSGKYGADCRACYNDVAKAHKNDKEGSRAIMCSNKEPVDVYGRRLTPVDQSDPLGVARDLEAFQEDASSPSEEEEHRQLTDVPKWKENEKWKNNKDDSIPKWKRNQKWKTNKDDKVPKWRANQKWKKQYEDSPDEGCLDGCEYTSKDKTRGRVCDTSCSDRNPYQGTHGCGAKSGKYGADCRACYNDVAKAHNNDTPDNRAIMCSNKEPVDVYGRRLTPVDESDPLGVARDLEAFQEDASSPLEEEEHRLLTDVPKWKENEKWKNNKDDSIPKWKQNQKWKTNKDGKVPKWKTNQKWKKQYEDSPDDGCLDGCEYTSKDKTRGRVCDTSCSDRDPYQGTHGCGAKSGKYGADCRACYNDVAKAHKNDTPDNRAIMCRDKKPVDVYGRRLTPIDESDPLGVARDLKALQEETSSPSEEEEHRLLTDVPKWKEQEKWKNNKDDSIPKWKRNQKWKTNKDDKVPKWRANQKWKKQYEDSPDEGCLDGCEYTSKDKTRGRVCDTSCSDSDPYQGTLGCGAKSGKYGADCRACYNDVAKAHKNDKEGSRAIMCSTKQPVDVYGRRLSADHENYSLELAQMMEAEDGEKEDSSFEPIQDADVSGRQKAIRFFEEAAERTYLDGLERSDLCAFVSGRVGEEAMWEVTVKSILQFVPGMRVAIAAEAEGLNAYERSMGGLPGVTVSGTQNPATAALYADKYCSLSEIILYVKPGSVLSRAFTPKDTHSPRGDLLVVHPGSQGSYHDAQLVRRTAAVLGFEAPSFTQGTDLMLPGDANAYLRESLGLGHDAHRPQKDGEADALIALQEFVDFDQVSAVPQVLAALAYSRKMPGVWFVDPRGWVGQNLFKEASIWDIPLVKPRYTCTIASDALDSASPKTAQVLQSSVDFFAIGGKCANGLIEYAA